MIHQLFQFAVSARRFIEPVWTEWHEAGGSSPPSVASRFTCGRTSLFLVKVLQAEGFEAQWQSGTPRLSEEGPELGPYGFYTGSRWESHAWVCCRALVIDITADQFGAEPIIVTSATDKRYGAGDKDTALPSFIAARHKAVDDIWPRWLDHRAAS
jgi:hypothetical protein